jgi:GTPase SAR1 family protein
VKWVLDFFPFFVVRSFAGWIDDAKRNVSQEKVNFAIIGNKSDLDSQRKVSKADAQQLAQSINAKYFETSAKDGTGLQEAFETFAHDIKKLQDGRQ